MRSMRGVDMVVVGQKEPYSVVVKTSDRCRILGSTRLLTGSFVLLVERASFSSSPKLLAVLADDEKNVVCANRLTATNGGRLSHNVAHVFNSQLFEHFDGLFQARIEVTKAVHHVGHYKVKNRASGYPLKSAGAMKQMEAATLRDKRVREGLKMALS